VNTLADMSSPTSQAFTQPLTILNNVERRQPAEMEGILKGHQQFIQTDKRTPDEISAVVNITTQSKLN